MFGYWSSCCEGSERVPKILNYIKHITFDEQIPTAFIDLLEGDIRIGVGFFLEHINGPEDLLLILVHERNHLILRKLYPDVLQDMDWPQHAYNFAEDVFVNAISRRQIPSTLPERFYKRPLELLLTGKHSRIDWDKIHYEELGCNIIKVAHGALYRYNYQLLKVLEEDPPAGTSFSGYEEWMGLAYRWHKHMQDKLKTKGPLGGEDKSAEDPGSVTEETLPETNGYEGSETNHDRSQKETSSGTSESEEESQDEPEQEQPMADSMGREVTKKEALESIREEEQSDSHDRPANVPQNIGEDRRQSTSDESADDVIEEAPDLDFDTALKDIVPLVQEEPNGLPSGHCGISADAGSGLRKIPIPDLRPNDPTVRLILATCEVPEIRHRVEVLDGDRLQHVEGLIKGMLSDRATERSYDGYSLSIPISITRRDVFSLCAGEIPVLWQKRVGIERPNIDLYVDVSGSMNRYYAYIPFIYDALKHIAGQVFQFSTRVVDVDPKDSYLYTTGGTSFNAVAKHMMERQVQSAILLSDGRCHMLDGHIERLKGQLGYFVYIKVKENRHSNWERIATETIVLESRRNRG
jgi:hypothetical protein